MREDLTGPVQFMIVCEWPLKRFVKKPLAKHVPKRECAISFMVKLAHDFPLILVAVENPIQFSEIAS